MSVARRITRISADSSGFSFELDQQHLSLVTQDPVIEAALCAAFQIAALVQVELLDDMKTVRRVHPFDVNANARPNEISRLATQTRPGSEFSLLELFVLDSSGFEQAFQTLDLPMQQMLCSGAARKGLKFLFTADGPVLQSVSFVAPPETS